MALFKGYWMAAAYCPGVVNNDMTVQDFCMRVGGTLNNLGTIALARGDYAVAAARFEEALVIAREIKDRELEIVSLQNLEGLKDITSRI